MSEPNKYSFRDPQVITGSELRYAFLFLCLSIVLTSVKAQDLRILGGYYFDEARGAMVKNGGITVKSGRITSLNDTTSQSSSRVLQLKESDYILPGIIDMHAHYKVHVGGKERTDTAILPILYLANGVTSTFTAGELEPEKILQLKSQINEGNRAGPRILNTGPYFGNDANSNNSYWKSGMSEKEIRTLIDAWAAKGIEGIKVKNVTLSELKIIIQQAHKYGLTVTGHLDSGAGETVNSEDAIELGIDRVEHFLGGAILPDSVSAYQGLAAADPRDGQLDAIMDVYIGKQIYYSPTISAYGMVGESQDEALAEWTDQLAFFTAYSKSVIGSQRRGMPFNLMFGKIYAFKKVEIKRFYDAGGGDLIVLGTDRQLRNGDIGGFAAHKEMQVLAASGIPTADVLRMASINGARALGKDNDLGSIDIGKWADFYIVPGNPLKDISRTREVHTVIKAGEVYSTDNLFNSAKGKIGPVNNSDWQE